MNFYDVMADGYHTPLTRTQIADLFRAGRLGRNQPCKQAEKTEWRTIDELFPLLKYDSSWPSPSAASEPAKLSMRMRLSILLALAGGIVSLALILYFFTDAIFGGSGSPTIFSKRTGRPANAPASYLHSMSQAATNNTPSTADARPVDKEQPRVRLATQATASDAPSQSVVVAPQAQPTQERLKAGQWQREQAQVARDRADAELRERERQEAAGRNEVVPLDQDTIIHNVGGSGVTIRIHDNDVTSFDVWINGARRREVIKQKGISGSRTDETWLYGNGRANLYYVWEISGILNHCLLRVRNE